MPSSRTREGGAGQARRPELREVAERASFRKRLSYRVTDLELMGSSRVRPLSVSSDRIGVTTFRCALLLDRLKAERRKSVDRSGRRGLVAEVYPAAALSAWGMERRGYKGPRASPRGRDL